MKTYLKPTGPGDWCETTSRSGYIRYYPLTPEMMKRRYSIAQALGYVLREPCSFCTSGRVSCDSTHKHFPCYESAEIIEGQGANFHHVHSRSPENLKFCGITGEGIRVWSWPEDAEKAAQIAEKGY